MLIIGLTGGIGSGKSTVAELFAERGAPIIDSDIIARELVRPGQPALAKIVDHFGAEVLDDEGNLNRRALRERVFSDPRQRQILEHILHPPILEEMRRRAGELTAEYCIFVIPLLIESGLQSEVDRILVVDTDLDRRRQRIKNRDGLTDADIDAVLASQVTREQRLAAADDVITNNADRTALALQVDHLHQRYRTSAHAHSSPKSDNSDP